MCVCVCVFMPAVHSSAWAMFLAAFFPHDLSFCFTKHNSQQEYCNAVLMTLKEHPEAWTRVDAVLEFSVSQQTKVWIKHCEKDVSL